MFASPHRGCVCHTVVTAAYSRKGKSDTSSCASPSWVLHLPNRTGYQNGGDEMAAAKGSPEEILGVRHGASRAEIRTAWRRLVRKHHPDRVAGNPAAVRAANQRMQEINAAAESLLQPTPGKRQETKERSRKYTSAVAIRGTDAAAAAKGIFFRVTDRLSSRAWSTLLFIGLLAFLEQESESAAATPLNGEYAMYNLLGITAALIIPGRIERFKHMGERGKSITAALTLTFALLPWGLIAGREPLPAIVGYLINVATSVPLLVQDVVNGVIQLVIGVATLVAIVGGVLFMFSGIGSSDKTSATRVRSPKIVFDSAEHLDRWTNERRRRK